MAILLFLIPISLLLLGVAIWAFVWSVRDGQFDDLDAAPLDILRDDPPVPSAKAHAPAAPEFPAPEQPVPEQPASTHPAQPAPDMPGPGKPQPRDAD